MGKDKRDVMIYNSFKIDPCLAKITWDLANREVYIGVIESLSRVNEIYPIV